MGDYTYTDSFKTCRKPGCTRVAGPSGMCRLHSTNGGRTWQPITVGSRSVIAQRGQSLQPGEIYDDGLGNLYRYEVG